MNSEFESDVPSGTDSCRGCCKQGALAAEPAVDALDIGEVGLSGGVTGFVKEFGFEQTWRRYSLTGKGHPDESDSESRDSIPRFR